MILILTPPLAAMAALLLSVSGAFAEPKTIYVAENGDDNQADVGTEWAKAYRNIQPAVDAAVEGDTVLVGDGTYYALDNSATCVLKITNSINVVSVNGSSKTVIDGILFKDDGSRDEKKSINRLLVSIAPTAKNAFFAGFTCTNGMSNAKNSGNCYGVSVGGGVASNIVAHLKNSWQSTCFTVSGGAKAYDIKVVQATNYSDSEPGRAFHIYDNGSLVDRLDLTNIAWPNGWAVLVVGSGNLNDTVTLRNVVMANNVIGTTATASALPISIIGKNIAPVFENCTFVNNRTTGKKPFITCTTDTTESFWKQDKLKVYNTIMADYTTEAGTPDSGRQWVSATFVGREEKNFFNCCCSELPSVNDNIAAAPMLDASFTPSVYSKCVNAGRNRPWVTNAVDFAGNPRLMFETVDIGAVECQEDPSKADLGCGFELLGESTGNYTLTTTLKGYAVGDDSGLTCAWVFSDGTTSTDWPTVEKTFAQAGRFSVSLYVTNALGQVATNVQENVFTVYPAKCYMKFGNQANAAFPYDTWETATTNIIDAVATAVDEIEVGDGSFGIPSPYCSLAKKLWIHSSNGPAATTLRGSFDSDGYYFASSAAAAGSLISGFTFRGGSGTRTGTPTAFSLADGTTVSNCEIHTRQIYKGQGSRISGTVVDSLWDFTDCSFSGQNDGYNTGVILEASGLLERCIFKGARVYGNSSTKASSYPRVVRSVGTLRNCLFWDCTNTLEKSNDFAAPILDVAGGRVENCTIADCGVSTWGAVKLAGDGALVNVISGGNTGPTEGWNDFTNASPETATVDHCLLNADPLFKRGTYLPRLCSPACDGGIMLPWMTEDAIDLAGNRRVVGGTPDIGCYESRNPGLLLLVR